MITQFICSVKNGKLKIHDKIGFLESLKTNEGKSFVLAVKPVKELRSVQQNNYYWGVVLKITAIAISEALGKKFSPDYAHEFFKGEFLKEDLEIVRDGQTIVVPRIKSTAELTKGEFGEYVEKIKEWAQDKLNCFVPSPESYYSDYDVEL